MYICLCFITHICLPHLILSMTNMIIFISVLIKDQDQCCRYEYLNSNSSFFLSSQFYGILGVFEKKGMLPSGRKMHDATLTAMWQHYFLLYRAFQTYPFDSIFLLKINTLAQIIDKNIFTIATLP